MDAARHSRCRLDRRRPLSQPQAPPRPSPVAATASISPAALNEPLSERQIVERANAYFNGMSTLTGDFVQTGGDGRRLTGKLYLQRPGRIRFEYDAPATIEVIADGSSVAVRDSKLVTQDLYAISQTPLKFLLRDHIDLGQDIRIVGVSLEPEGARVLLEDKSTLRRHLEDRAVLRQGCAHAAALAHRRPAGLHDDRRAVESRHRPPRRSAPVRDQLRTDA